MQWDLQVFDSFWSITFKNQTATFTITKQPAVPAGKKKKSSAAGTRGRGAAPSPATHG